MQNGSLCDTPYQGQALDQEVSFRLLELQSGQPGSPIVVSLLTVDLSSASSYEALSYTWGDVTEVEEIEVITTTAEESKSTPLSVTTSCAAALRRLRSSGSPRTLWIDFICINQSDVPERNHQLALMPRIYNGASRVVVYLGESSESDSSDAVMLWLQNIHSPSEPANAPPIPQSDTIRAFLNRRWFTRVWVMQEVRLAKEATVICGDKEVPWDAFRMLRDIFNNKRREQPLPYTV
ncbi:heterokaryon incompatibility protein [Colletotrichum plurivorum]|uniref:Heterokaryon incompatibility protein n=1 Tax=Colletotrichum plurivorum TaxID=2175906 RepID=A0A8H6MWA5_9PEZI|nr:heterokaryon incompatibility protein [Colletotrichum plurivorum]